LQIGFELWTMQNDILFDNIYIGHSVEDALALKKETFDLKIVAEKAEEKAAEPKFDEEKESSKEKVLTFKDDPVKFVRDRVEKFIAEFKKDPVEAVKNNPETAAPIGVTILAVVAVLLTLLSPAPPTKADIKAAGQKAKDASEKAKDKGTPSVATGADQSKDSVQKRTTRSSDKS
jgi:calnexin